MYTLIAVAPQHTATNANDCVPRLRRGQRPGRRDGRLDAQVPHPGTAGILRLASYSLEAAMRGAALILVALAVAAMPAGAQTPAGSAAAPPAIVLGPPPPPATALEAFGAAAGDILTTAYEDLGEVDGVFVEAREMRDSRGGRARGVVVTIADRGPAGEPLQAFVDPDEFTALLRGFDALLAITVTPNAEFRNFDMRYATRGELVLTASSTRQRGVIYGVEVGRQFRTRRSLNGGEFHQLRTLVEAAEQKLATLSGR